MNLHFRTIFKVIGLVLIIAGFAMILPLATAIVYGEEDSRNAFACTIVPCLFFGFIMFKFIHHSAGRLRLRDGFLIVALCWLLISTIGTVPVVVSGAIPSFFDGLFEMCSGFTTTGASAVADIEALPKTVLMWRALSHWLGGMGILVLAIALFPTLGISGQEIVEAETPGPVLSKLTPKMSETARGLYSIYLGFTALETVLLIFGGMDFFDAITHAFSTVGTGGFSNYNDSVAHFNSPYINMVICVFMILCGINFNLFYALLRNRAIPFFKDMECRVYLMFITAFTVIIAAWLWVSDTVDNIFQALHHSLFQVASIISTTGFATTDFGKWPPLCIMVLFCIFFIGGSSSSTAGGVKVIRVLVMLKMIKRSIMLKLHPNALINIRYNGRILSTDIVQGICAFVFLYATTFFAVSLFISLDNHDMLTNLSAAATCLGNIGPGFGLVGPSDNFSIFSDGMKFVLSLTMVAGRLELFTLLMLLSGKFWNPNE